MCHNKISYSEQYTLPQEKLVISLHKFKKSATYKSVKTLAHNPKTFEETDTALNAHN